VLRKRFVGQPEHVINFFFFVAEEVRELMAQMGYRRFDELIGQMQMLDKEKALAHWKAKGLDFSKLFHKPAGEGAAIRHSLTQDHGLDKVLDNKLIEAARASIDRGAKTSIETAIRNVDRSTGAMLSGEVARVYGLTGLPEDTIDIRAAGTAGQSFGAFLARGVTLRLEGEANDYVGKGLSGGKVIVYPSREAKQIVPEKSIIVGNTVLYGAVGGEAYLRGVAGERFAVRNSGAYAVVEGVGDHGCEYMTGGVVVVLGQTGRNFAAGMSGGVAYVLDEDGGFAERCNLAMVDLEPVRDEETAMTQAYHQSGDLEQHGRVDVMSDMTRFDAERLKHLISNHLRYTGSTRARAILDDWESYKPKFRKVMPVEYRRALTELLARSQSGEKLKAAGE
jgi:glutamate synthase (NADPH/NADH) large chain